MHSYLLVIAASARMLAQAAVAAGFKVLVIDLYADVDTRNAATAFCRIPSLAADQVAAAVDVLMADYPLSQVVYGSGFERHPESLHYLDEKLTVWGNSPAVFAQLQNKPLFFSVLANFAIPFPETVFSAPAHNRQWLLKPMQGQGGVGIRRYGGGNSAATAEYWQEYQAGSPCSVLFLANGEHAEVVGFNRQWTVKLGEGHDFAFAGIINYTDLTVRQQATISGWLMVLVPFFGLKGLNSLDFIEDNGKFWILEINPRPSASMQLYDGDLLGLHIRACAGQLQVVEKQAGCTAYEIVYAPQDMVIPDAVAWPEGCVDLPDAGVICRKAQPICSIIARHKLALAVLQQLALARHTLFKQLHIGFDPHGISS